MRGRQEHTDMLFGDLSMKATSDGKQYLEYCERETKTRKGESGNTRSFAPKMFEIPGKPFKRVFIKVHVHDIQIKKNTFT